MHKQLINLAAAILLPAVSLASGVLEGFEKPENYPDPLRLEAEIKAYEWIDYVMAPARGAVVATGSSSISGWNNRIHADLAPLTIIPRGFGSSTMYDLLYFADKIVLPYKPRAILIYEGDNDISWGSRPKIFAGHSTLWSRKFTNNYPTPEFIYWRLNRVSAEHNYGRRWKKRISCSLRRVKLTSSCNTWTLPRQ